MTKRFLPFLVIAATATNLPASERPPASTAPVATRLVASAALPLLAAPDFKLPLGPHWQIAHGTYEPVDGVLVCAERPTDKHAGVLWHQVGWDTGVMECEFRFDGARNFILGCDSNGPRGFAHVGRAIITPQQICLAEDSVKPSHTLVKLAVNLSPGRWHHARLEWRGDRMVLEVDGAAVRTQHAFLATPKARSWLAVGGQTVAVRALTIRGLVRAAKEPTTSPAQR
jgi:hypothetical protein